MTLFVQPHDGPFSKVLSDELLRSLAKDCKVVVAWVTSGGLDLVEDSLNLFLEAGGIAEFLIGVDGGNTSREALERLDALQKANGGLSIYVIHERKASPGPIFHPKGYLFTSEADFTLWVGSNNLTQLGQWTSIELALGTKGELDSDDHRRFKRFVDELKGDAEHCKRLDAALIESLDDDGLLARDKQAAEQSGWKDPDKKKTSATTGNASGFGKPSKRPPVPRKAKKRSDKPSIGAAEGTAEAEPEEQEDQSDEATTDHEALDGLLILARTNPSRGKKQAQPPQALYANLLKKTSVYFRFEGDPEKKLRKPRPAKAHDKSNTLKLEVAGPGAGQSPVYLALSYDADTLTWKARCEAGGSAAGKWIHRQLMNHAASPPQGFGILKKAKGFGKWLKGGLTVATKPSDMTATSLWLVDPDHDFDDIPS